MGLPVDAYALNAILRLLLRLTRTFDYAVIFAQMGGVKMLLDLTQASSFSGFFSLVSKGFFVIILGPGEKKKLVKSNKSISRKKNYIQKKLREIDSFHLTSFLV